MKYKKYLALISFVILVFGFPMPSMASPTSNFDVERFNDISTQDLIKSPELQKSVLPSVTNNLDQLQASSKLGPHLQSWVKNGISTEAMVRYGGDYSILAMAATDDPTLNGMVNTVSYLPFADSGVMLIHATVDSYQDVLALQENELVIRIEADIQQGTTGEPARQKVSPRSLTPPETTGPSVGGSVGVDAIDANNSIDARSIIGANYVEDTYGYDGTGVTVNVHDTGIDFGHTGLVGTMQLDANNETTAYDGQGYWMSVSSLYWGMNTTFFPGNSTMTLDVDAFKENYGMYYYGSMWSFSTFEGAGYTLALNDTWDLSAITDTGTTLYNISFGYHLSWLGAWQHIPFIMADTTDDGSFDSMYFDWSTGYANQQYTYGASSTHPVNATGAFSFSPKAVTNTNNQYLSADVDGDGYNDISTGALGVTYDAYNVTGWTMGESPLKSGIDPSGMYFSYFSDDQGHGTGVSGDLVGQPIGFQTLNNETFYHTGGVAPGAKVVGTHSLSTSQIIGGWLWATGYEINETLGWEQTGDHIAEMSSNSWGGISWDISGQAPDYGFYTLLMEMISHPGYLNTTHPGILFVHSAGNSGPGFSTSGWPSSATEITVGASTTMMFFQDSSYAGEVYGDTQGYDEVMTWSSSGPGPTAYPKVDVVNVGAYDYSFEMTIPARGNGTVAWQLFGGTSQAAPMTAGAMAMIFEAYVDVNAIGDINTVDDSMLKSLLKSTTSYMGLDPYHGGAGRVDVGRAVDYLANSARVGGTSEELFNVRTSDSYSNIAQRKQFAFLNMFTSPHVLSDGFNSTFTHPGLTEQYFDAAVYGGIVPEGTSSTVDITVENDADVNSVTAWTQQEVFTETASFTHPDGSYWNNISLYDTFTSASLDGSTMLQVVISYDGFDQRWAAGGAANEPVSRVIKWNDDGDTVFEQDERSVYTYETHDYSANTYYLSTQMIDMNTYIIVGDQAFDGGFDTLNYTISVRGFNEVDASTYGVTVSGANSPYTVTMDSTGLSPGFQSGFVKVEGTGGGMSMIPYSFSVPDTTQSWTENGNAWNEITGSSGRVFDNSFSPAQYYGEGPINGDWRLYDLYIDGTSPSFTAADTLAIEVEWENPPSSQLDLYLIDYNGSIIATSDIQHDGGNVYSSMPNDYNNQTQKLLVNMTEYQAGFSDSDMKRTFTLAIQQVRFNGTSVPNEALTVRSAWTDETLDQWDIPMPTLQTSGDQNSPVMGFATTNDTIGVEWNEVTGQGQPIPEFNTNGSLHSYSIGAAVSLQVPDGVITDADKQADTSQDLTYSVLLSAGMQARAVLDWPDSAQDLDLFLIPASVADQSDWFNYDLFGFSGADTSIPEEGSATIPEDGEYIIVVDWWGGTSGDVSFSLDFTASQPITSGSGIGATDGTFNVTSSLEALGVGNGLFTVSSEIYGWNFDNSITTNILYDTQAPAVTETTRIDENVEGDIVLANLLDVSNFTVDVTFDGTAYGTFMFDAGSNDLMFPSEMVSGFETPHTVVLDIVDEAGYTDQVTFEIKRVDTVAPTFTEAPPLFQFAPAGEEIDLHWAWEDNANSADTSGTYTLTNNNTQTEVSSGTWDLTGSYEHHFTLTEDMVDENNNLLFIMTIVDVSDNTLEQLVTIRLNNETTIPPTSDDGGDEPEETGGFLSFPAGISAMVLSTAFIAIVRLRRKR